MKCHSIKKYHSIKKHIEEKKIQIDEEKKHISIDYNSEYNRNLFEMACRWRNERHSLQQNS